MMSRKDYEMFAGSIFRPQVDTARVIRNMETSTGLGGVAATTATTLQTMAYNLVQHLSADNSRFDHRRFYEACGFVIVGNYPKVFPEDD